MGLFSRKQPVAPAPAPHAVPASTPASSGASQSDLDAARRLMARFAEVRGNGSDQELANILEKFADITGASFAAGWNRPWAWWLTVARQAHELARILQ